MTAGTDENDPVMIRESPQAPNSLRSFELFLSSGLMQHAMVPRMANRDYSASTQLGEHPAVAEVDLYGLW